MAEFTKADAVRKANAIKKANPDFPPAKIKAIIEKQNGPLVFNGEPFYFKPTGSGSLAIESVAARNTRKRRSNTERNRQIRRKTPKQQEFIDEAKKFFEENNLQKLDGKTARQYGIEKHREAKEALKVKKTNISEAGLTAGHIDPAVGGETLERTGNYFGEPGQQNFTNRNRKPNSRTAKALQVQLPREEAIQRTMGFGQDLPEFTDAQVDATLKGQGKPLGGVSQQTRLKSPVSPVNGALRFQRRAAMAAAAGGALAPAFLGTAASASELQMRTEIAEQTKNPLDRIQQGIAGTSLVLDGASYIPVAAVPAGIASAGLDVLNVGIDTGRELVNYLGGIFFKNK